MSARKNRKPGRLPAIVPRFLKSAVTIGAIPALVGCEKGPPKQRVQPVVATYIDKSPPVVAAYAPDAPVQQEVAPVVAAWVTDQPPPPPHQSRDAGVDAAPKKKPKLVKPPPPGPVVVAAMVGRPDLNDLVGVPPPVVAAMVPNQNLVAPTPKKTKKP